MASTTMLTRIAANRDFCCTAAVAMGVHYSRNFLDLRRARLKNASSAAVASSGQRRERVCSLTGTRACSRHLPASFSPAARCLWERERLLQYIFAANHAPKTGARSWVLFSSKGRHVALIEIAV